LPPRARRGPDAARRHRVALGDGGRHRGRGRRRRVAATRGRPGCPSRARPPRTGSA
jgi:hypothetical protein